MIQIARLIENPHQSEDTTLLGSFLTKKNGSQVPPRAGSEQVLMPGRSVVDMMRVSETNGKRILFHLESLRANKILRDKASRASMYIAKQDMLPLLR